MANLGASHFAVSITDESIMGKKRFVFGTLTLTGGSDVYTTAGVALPAIANFGMKRQLDGLILFGGAGTETTKYISSYDKVNHKLQLFEEEASAAGGPPPECDTSEAPGTRVWYFLAIGW